MTLVVGAIIVDDLGAPTQVLAARRTHPPKLCGKWEFPGGKVDADESPENALLRELNEELGIRARLGHELRSPDAAAWRISDEFALRLWFVEVIEGEPQPIDSHDELRWLDAENLGSVDWLDADRQVLDLIFRR